MQAWKLAGAGRSRRPGLRRREHQSGKRDVGVEDPIPSLETLPPDVACTNIRDSSVWRRRRRRRPWTAWAGRRGLQAVGRHLRRPGQERPGVPRNIRRAAAAVQVAVAGFLQAVAKDARTGPRAWLAVAGRGKPRQAFPPPEGPRAPRRGAGLPEGRAREEPDLLPDGTGAGVGNAAVCQRISRPRPWRFCGRSPATTIASGSRRRKGDFDRHVEAPLLALLEHLASDLHTVAPELACSPKDSTFRQVPGHAVQREQVAAQDQRRAGLSRRAASPRHAGAGLYMSLDARLTCSSAAGNIGMQERASRSRPCASTSPPTTAGYGRSWRRRRSASDSGKTERRLADARATRLPRITPRLSP